MRITLLAILILISSITTANSACEGETCIDVKADQESNEVVITVKKGKAGGEASTSPKPKPTPTPKVTSISCIKGNQLRKVTGVKPKCPTGFKKRS